jgi:hypothetical protein
MKQGFFLLEALCACLVLFLLAGSTIHHYGQWTRSHRSVIHRKNALVVLTTILEQGTKESAKPENYTYSEQSLACSEPSSSLILPSSVSYPRVQCREITLSWQEEGRGIQSLSIVAGDL